MNSMNNAGPKPWEVRGWVWSRIKELLWQGLSWAYVIAVALTANFLIRDSGLSRDAMLAAWTIAFGVRFVAAPLADAKASSIQKPRAQEPPAKQAGSP